MLSFSISVLAMIILVAMLAYAAVIPDYKTVEEYNQYAVIFPVSFSQDQSISSVIDAGGLPLRAGTFDFIQIIATQDENFEKKMYNRGAVFVFSPMIKGACYFENKARFRVHY